MSNLLDSLRTLSALAVFLGHTNFSWFFGDSSLGPKNGQDYVIVFFVLSGFVIAWSIDVKKHYTFNQYAFDRLTRLWSVVIPALLIGYFLDFIGSSIHAETYKNIFSSNFTELKFIISSFFLHETWFFSVRPGSNGPFWSLSYEFFYYLIFGSVILIQNFKLKILICSIICLIAGPKVLLLFPCWLLGCASYYCCKICRPNLWLAIIISITSSSLLVHFSITRWNSWSPWEYNLLGEAPYFYSAKFLEDYLIATIVSLFLISNSRWLSLNFNRRNKDKNFLNKCAASSFSLYAFHFPLLAFIGAISACGRLPHIDLYGAVILCFLLCYIFSLFFEKSLKGFRKQFLNFFPFLKNKCGIHS